MNVAVVIAYDDRLPRGPARHEPFLRVRAHLAELGWPIHIAGDDHQPYRRALAINRTVEALQADVLVLNDADLLAPLDNIRKAVEAARQAPGPVFAFDTYMRTGEPDGRERTLTKPPSNGCLAITTESFLEVGGYDEHFVGWGPEDLEFNDRCEAMYGELRRVPGTIRHLYHGPRRRDDSVPSTSPAQVAANWRRYKTLAANR